MSTLPIGLVEATPPFACLLGVEIGTVLLFTFPSG